MKKPTLILIFSFLLVFPAFAQEQAGVEFDVLKVGVGARPLGMGSAFTAVADDINSGFWNPAGLAKVKDNQITTSQTRLSSDADHYYVSYARPLGKGAFYIGWIQIGLSGLTETSTTDANNEVVNLGTFSYFSNAYLLSYGYPINDKLSFGINGTYLTSDMQDIAGGQAKGYSVTPGFIYQHSDKISLGLKVEDLFNEKRWGTGTREKAPVKYHLGFAYKSPNPCPDTAWWCGAGTFAVDLVQVAAFGYTPSAYFGYEYDPSGPFSLRLGYSDDSLSAGAGFRIDHVIADYAFVQQTSLTRENCHRISLSGTW